MSQRHSFICGNTGPLAPEVVLCHREGDTGMLKICILQCVQKAGFKGAITLVYGLWKQELLGEAKSRKCVGVRHSEKVLRHLSRHSWQRIDATLLVSGDPRGQVPVPKLWHTWLLHH